MKFALFASLLFVTSLPLLGCTEEGYSADCSVGGRGNLEEEGCLTPLGGACLSEEEFKANRPSRYEDDRGVEQTVEDDWLSYQAVRPECEFP